MTAVDGAQSVPQAEPQSAAAPSPFPPIASFGFLSNCHTAALVAPDGGIGWLCVPVVRLAERVRARCSIARPATSASGRSASTSRPRASYEPGTNTLVTTWHTPSGWVVVRDALTMGPRTGEDTVTPHTRPPADEDGDHLLVRTIECIEGSVEMELVCEPVFDYGRTAAEWTLHDGRHTRRRERRGRDAAPVHRHGDRDRGRPRARPPHAARGRGGVLLAVVGGGPRVARRASRRRRRGWPRRRASGARGSTARGSPTTQFREPIARSILTIKGLTYMPTGATVAAATTSLPETPGGERNWDYRYAWMRDATFTLQALHWLNLDWEAEEFMQYVADLEPNADGAMQIMYGIDGRRDLTESTRDDLSGYAGARPVRIGNGAFDQRQNDVYGAVLDCILLHTRRSQRLSRRLWPIVETPGRVRDARLARARPGHLGGARRAAALRLVEAHVLGRDGPGGQARRHPRRRREAAALARGRRGDPRRHPRARRRRARRAAPALRDRRARRLEPAGRDLRLPRPTTTRGCARACWRSPTS